MMSENELLESVNGAIVRGGETYFDAKSAIEIINRCDVEGFAVIGIEVFQLSESATQPDSSLIADFSTRLDKHRWKDVREANNREAKEFVRRAPVGRYFNFVLATADDAERDEQR